MLFPAKQSKSPCSLWRRSRDATPMGGGGTGSTYGNECPLARLRTTELHDNRVPSQKGRLSALPLLDTKSEGLLHSRGHIVE